MKIPRWSPPGAVVIVVLLVSPTVHGWSNGPNGNATTDELEECGSPPYATHDWIADHALALLPDDEQVWLLPDIASFLLGTEAPDNDDIPEACNAPHTGYDDRRLGHSVEWNADWTKMVRDRAAVRAQEEYDKAALAYEQDDPVAAAFFLGAMAHYVGDVSAYPHSIPNEDHHSDYENRVKRRTISFDTGHYETYVELDRLVRRRAYTAVKIVSKGTGQGRGSILSAAEMDSRYFARSQENEDSVGHSLNLGVNALADVLHTFFLNVVDKNG